MAEKLEFFEGWAVVELFGHGREFGYVTTRYFGNQPMFQVDSPEIPERESLLVNYAYMEGVGGIPAGSKVKKALIPSRSRLLGMASILAINPTGENSVKAELSDLGAILEVIEPGPEPQEFPF